MKRSYTYFIFGLVMFLSVDVTAQNQPADISIGRKQIEVNDSVLYMNFDIDISRLKIKSNQGIVLIPVLQSASVMKMFPEVIINGRNRHISYNRMIGNKHKSEGYNEPYTVVKFNRKTQAIISYSMEVPFEPWMENSTLLLQEDVCGCRNNIQITFNNIVKQNIVKLRRFTPLLTYLSPELNVSEYGQDSIVSALFFPDSKATLLTNYGQNLQNITTATSVMADKNLIITGINIVAGASPEGTYNYNEQLSKERAQSLAFYFETHYNIPARLIETKWVGEDWNLLLKLVEQSDMKYKQPTVDIIKNTGVFSGRENDLMKLMAGKPYLYMQEHFFHQLRRASYTIRYHKAPFDITKGRELIFTSPNLLSVDEMLFIADSYPQNSAEYKKITGIAAKMYSGNPIANINASSVALSAGDTVAAKQYLERFKENPSSWNNLGVMYSMEGNYDLAFQYFQKAIDNGNTDAVYNMKKLNYMVTIP